MNSRIYTLKKDILNIEKYSALFIASYPILSPYSLAKVPLTIYMSIILLFTYFIKNSLKIYIKKEIIPLIIFVIISIMFSINGLFVLIDRNNLMNQIIMLFICLFLYYISWTNTHVEKVIGYADIIATVACVYALYQVIMISMGQEVPNGKIPFFEITTSWVPETWGFRINSLFSEPSYFAIYLMPIFAYHLLKEEWFKVIFFGFFIVVSSSTLGIISLIIVITWYMIFNKKIKVKYILIFILALCIGYILYLKIPSISTMIDRSLDKMFGIGDMNFKEEVRIFGHLEYFRYLPLKEQIFGVGLSQLQNYFLQIGIYLSNYSNSFVLTLINSGFIGLLCFILYLFNLFLISRKKNSIIFFILLFLTISIDSIMIGYRFFWLAYFVYYYNE